MHGGLTIGPHRQEPTEAGRPDSRDAVDGFVLILRLGWYGVNLTAEARGLAFRSNRSGARSVRRLSDVPDLDGAQILCSSNSRARNRDHSETVFAGTSGCWAM